MTSVSDVTLLVSLSLLTASAAISERLGLGQGRTLVLSCLRAAVQLLLVGQILKYVFALDSPVVLGGYLAWMIGAAVWVVWGRIGPRKIFALRKFDIVLVLVGLGTSTVVLAQQVRVMGGDRLPASATLVSFVGIVLGNVLTSLSLAVERFQSEVKASRSLIEARLLGGASIWEAGSESRRIALRAGMTPILNALASAGIVSLPGALTGQLLSGQDPVNAVRVQVLILFALALSSWAGCSALLLLLSRRWTDFEREAFKSELFL